jgi:hypothetical protein
MSSINPEGTRMAEAVFVENRITEFLPRDEGYMLEYLDKTMILSRPLKNYFTLRYCGVLPYNTHVLIHIILLAASFRVLAISAVLFGSDRRIECP